MKIVENTPERLRLRHRPLVAPIFCWVLAASQVGVMLTRSSTLSGFQWIAVVGLAVGCAFAGVLTGVGTRVLLDAQERTLRWVRSGPFAYRRESVRIALDSVRSVHVQELPPGADTGPAWRVAIATCSKSLPLTFHYGTVGDHEKLAETIRAWLRAASVELIRERAAPE